MRAIIALSHRLDAAQTLESHSMIGTYTPYCDRHNAPMRPNWILPGAFCGCTKEKLCQRRYDASIGYYADDPEHTHQLYCPTHYAPLFVLAYDPDHDSRQYACPEHECDYVTEWLPTSHL